MGLRASGREVRVVVGEGGVDEEDDEEEEVREQASRLRLPVPGTVSGDVGPEASCSVLRRAGRESERDEGRGWQ